MRSRDIFSADVVADNNVGEKKQLMQLETHSA
jgi:hypothetical protein